MKAYSIFFYSLVFFYSYLFLLTPACIDTHVSCVKVRAKCMSTITHVRVTHYKTKQFKYHKIHKADTFLKMLFSYNHD